MSERSIRVGELDLRYETFGDPADPALLLVMGFGTQLPDWPRRFCQAFADAGYHVIRYDHRDVGLSTKLDHLGSGQDIDAVAYTLADMADDGIGLVRALGIDKVHVLGASMGGMIAQEMALRHPDVVLSLCSIMSTTGAPEVGGPDPRVWAALAEPVPDGRDHAIERAVLVRRLVNGGVYPLDEDEARRRAAASYDRCFHPAGALRHRAAVRLAPDRTERLRELRMPVLVIHGENDPLVSVTGGIATADAVPGAELLVLPGVGHEFPEQLERRIVAAFDRNARRQLTA